MGSLWLGQGTVRAQPANDSRLTPTVIAALPYSDTLTAVDGATVAPDDPEAFCVLGPVSQGFHTVWYRYVASTAEDAPDRYVTVTTGGTGDTIVQVFDVAGDAIAGIPGGCNDDAIGIGGHARIDGLALARGRTYLIGVTYYEPLPAGAALQLSVAPSPVHVVTKTDDTLDGSCDADCSLREAVAAAGSAGGAIELPAGTYVLTRAGPDEDSNVTGDLDPARGMSINGIPAGGKRPAIQQTTDDRIVEHRSRGTLILRDLVVTGGFTRLETAFFTEGGAIRSSPYYLAGERIDVVKNISATSGGGIAADSALWLRDVRIGGNLARFGGGLDTQPPTAHQVRVERTAIVGNVATESGGGAFVQLTCIPFCQGAGTNIAVHFENVTFSGNQSSTAALVLDGVSDSRVVLRHLTLADNQAAGLSVTVNPPTTVLLERSAFGRNLGASGAVDCTTTTPARLVAALNSAQAPGNCPWANDSDVVADIGLGTLTMEAEQAYHAPDVQGPLVDRDAEGCASTDQRGILRPQVQLREGTPCDRGAIELDIPFVREELLTDGFE
jgi:CSLREA domain-containing protein